MKDNLVYNWLRERTKNTGWIARKDINFNEIAKSIGKTRQTASVNFKKLLENETIIFNKELDRYELTNSCKDSFLFYKEYAEVVKKIEDWETRLKVFDAIVDYGLEGRYDKSDKEVNRYMYIIEGITREKRTKWVEN